MQFPVCRILHIGTQNTHVPAQTDGGVAGAQNDGQHDCGAGKNDFHMGEFNNPSRHIRNR
jgi:hypothetical protein